MSDKRDKKRCRDCGTITYERTVGTPGSSCPERNQAYATHRWYLVDE
jgi:RNA polymerase subunit RPABC4/transcription elongation factor Spt4